MRLNLFTLRLALAAIAAGCGLVTASETQAVPSPLVQGSARTGLPVDSVRIDANDRGLLERRQIARDKRENLITIANQIANPAQLDTLRGLSREDKAFLLRRHRILHPVE